MNKVHDMPDIENNNVVTRSDIHTMETRCCCYAWLVALLVILFFICMSNTEGFKRCDDNVSNMIMCSYSVICLIIIILGNIYSIFKKCTKK